MSRSFLLILWTLLALPGMSYQQQTADMILINGEIITMNTRQPRAQAIAIKDNRILKAGSTDSIRSLATPATQILDLKGATVIPGFIEGHGHLKSMGYARMNLDLMKAKNWAEIVSMVKDAAAAAAPGEWIIGRGWHQEKWQPAPVNAVEGYPKHNSLSAVSPDNPVLLTHASGHALFANAKAMALAGIDEDTPEPDGGHIVRDENGQAVGVFEETAEGLIRQAHRRSQADMTAEQFAEKERKALLLAIEECLEKGVTSFQDAGSSFADIDRYKQLADEGKLGIRLWVMLGENDATIAQRIDDYRIKDYANHHLTVGGIKRYVDGALGSRGAWLLKPYADLPSSTGQNVTALADLAASAKLAAKTGLQLCTHAIGDRGNREMLNIYADTLQGRDLRWRIEHAQHLHPDDVPRMARMKVIASMQGVHCTSDAPFVEKRLGETRAREGAYVWRKLTDAGVVVTNGTDAPVEDVNPLASYYAMVTRKPANGDAFYPEQALSSNEALAAYTVNNAYATFQENEKGRIMPGYLADVTVLSADITRIPKPRIPNTQVLYTIVGGKILYQNTITEGN